MARGTHTSTAGTHTSAAGATPELPVEPSLYTTPRFQFDGDDYPIIALIHGAGPTVVWHIDTDPNAKTRQRLGAWVVGVGDQVPSIDMMDPTSWAGARLADAALPPLLIGRAIVATASGRVALDAVTLDEVSESVTPSGLVAFDVTTAQLQGFTEHLRVVDAASRSTNPVVLADIPAWDPEATIAEAAQRAESTGADSSSMETSTSSDPLDAPEVRQLMREGLALSEKIVDIIAVWNENESRRRWRKALRAEALGGEKGQVIPLILAGEDES